MLTDQLRKAIRDSGLSQYRIGKDCDIDKAAMSRFMSGERGLSLKSIDRVAEYLGLELVRRKRKRKG